MELRSTTCNIIECVICNGCHPNIQLASLTDPVVKDNKIYSYSAICPKNNQTILISRYK